MIKRKNNIINIPRNNGNKQKQDKGRSGNKKPKIDSSFKPGSRRTIKKNNNSKSNIKNNKENISTDHQIQDITPIIPDSIQDNTGNKPKPSNSLQKERKMNINVYTKTNKRNNLQR